MLISKRRLHIHHALFHESLFAGKELLKAGLFTFNPHAYRTVTREIVLAPSTGNKRQYGEPARNDGGRREEKAQRA